VSLGVQLVVRAERPEDFATIRLVNEAAFGRPDEADLVDALRVEGAVLHSFVAERGRNIVGHVLFSRVIIQADCGQVAAVALAPVAVLPAHQSLGIGSRLIRHGLHRLREDAEKIVLVLGELEYYARFGFSAEKARRLITPFPPESYMALELSSGALDGVEGCVRYAAAFGL
jgi:putative acetyltransferase